MSVRNFIENYEVDFEFLFMNSIDRIKFVCGIANSKHFNQKIYKGQNRQFYAIEMKFVYRFNNITASSKMNNNIGFSGWSLQYVIRIVWSKPCIVVNISNEIFGCNIPRTTVNSRHLLQTGNTMRKKKPISIKNVYKYLVLHPAIFCNINRQITKREREK